jgi:hypothetical protein
MNSSLRNFLLLIIVSVLSYFTAPYFGFLYDKFSPQYNNSFLGTGRDLSLFVAGLPVAYVFFIPFLFELLGSGKRRNWMLWLLVLPALLWISVDIYYIYVPIVLGAIAFFFAWFIRFIVSKFRHPNLPMVINNR